MPIGKVIMLFIDEDVYIGIVSSHESTWAHLVSNRLARI